MSNLPATKLSQKVGKKRVTFSISDEVISQNLNDESSSNGLEDESSKTSSETSSDEAYLATLFENVDAVDQIQKSNVDFTSIRKRQEFRRQQSLEYHAAYDRDLQRLNLKHQKILQAEAKFKNLKAAKLQAEKLMSDFRLDLSSRAEFTTNKPSNTVEVLVKLPSGKKLVKMFNFKHQIQHVRACILLEDEIKCSWKNLEIKSTFPSKSYANDQDTLLDAFGEKTKKILLYVCTSQESSESHSDSELM